MCNLLTVVGEHSGRLGGYNEYPFRKQYNDVRLLLHNLISLETVAGRF